MVTIGPIASIGMLVIKPNGLMKTAIAMAIIQLEPMAMIVPGNGAIPLKVGCLAA